MFIIWSEVNFLFLFCFVFLWSRFLVEHIRKTLFNDIYPLPNYCKRVSWAFIFVWTSGCIFLALLYGIQVYLFLISVFIFVLCLCIFFVHLEKQTDTQNALFSHEMLLRGTELRICCQLNNKRDLYAQKWQITTKKHKYRTFSFIFSDICCLSLFCLCFVYFFSLFFSAL